MPKRDYAKKGLPKGDYAKKGLCQKGDAKLLQVKGDAQLQYAKKGQKVTMPQRDYAKRGLCQILVCQITGQPNLSTQNIKDFNKIELFW